MDRDKAIRAARLTLSGMLEKNRHATAVGRAGGQVAPSKYLPDVPRAVHADGGRENGDSGHIYVVHGGSDFDQIDPSYSGRGEPGGIRPLGKGLYGYILDHADPERAERAINGAKMYSRKYGSGKKTLHVYKVPKTVSTSWNGLNEFDRTNVPEYPPEIKGLGGLPEKELAEYEAHARSEEPKGDDYWPWFRKKNQLSDRVKQAADMQLQHLPIGITEAAIQNPKVATRIGKFGVDTPTSDILDAVKGDAQTRATGGRAVHADGGPAMFEGIHPDLQDESGAPLDLYHGTTQDKEFEAFDDAKLGARDAGFHGRGHYLTPVREGAKEYAGNGTVIGPLHAALKNPYIWDLSDEGKSSKTLRDLQSMGIMQHKEKLKPWDTLEEHHIQPFMAEMQKRGHDGVIVKTGHEWLPNGISEVVAFDPRSIKHKEAEVFDPTDPRIRREDGGEVEKKRDFMRDNPGGEWLEGKRARAAQYPGDKFMIGATTGVIGGRSSMFLPTNVLKGIAGLNDEVRTAGVSKYDSLLSDAQKGGFDPEQKGNKVVVAVNHFGQPYLLEGNTRVAVAHSMGIPKVRAEVRYWNGAENVDGPMHPENVFNMASDSPDVAKADGGEVDGDEDGITAYHGSPHSFDQFDIANLGTGEGAQAYGHGLYFAGNEKVAKGYRDALSRPLKTGNLGRDLSNYAVSQKRGLVDDAIEYLKKEMSNYENKPSGWPSLEYKKQYEDALNILRAGQWNPYGHMYKVKLHVKPEELLDWDKPLSEQPHVLKAIDSRYGDPEIVMQQLGHDINTATGRDFHDSMAGTVGNNQGAAQRLQDMGLKGIRYRDAGSRDLSDGDPTHNYVMFHHDPVKVVDKYEYGGEVHKATGGPVMGYVPMASLTVPRLAVARAPVQQQQAPAARFSESLNSLMDTVEGFKKKPDAAADSPSAASGSIPLPDEGYEATGMYAPFQSAIDRMIADAPGRITVSSGYRTPEEQEALWNQHAVKYPDPEVRDDYVARAGQSSHNYGLAADLSYADQEALKWAQENAPRYGLNFRMSHENWHIEPANIWELRNAMTVPGYANGGSAMGDDNQDTSGGNNVESLSLARSLRNIGSGGGDDRVQNLFDKIAAGQQQAQKAYEMAHSNGEFNDFKIGDTFVYKHSKNPTPMKITGFSVSRAESFPQRKRIYNNHVPVLEMEDQDAGKKVNKYPVEAFQENLHKYDFVSGKPRAVKAGGGFVSKALALTRGFTKDGKSAISALKPKGK